MEFDNLNDFQKHFYTEQMRNSSVPCQARRYHPDIVRWAIELYSRSPSAYQHLRVTDILKLPDPRTIRSYRFDATVLTSTVYELVPACLYIYMHLICRNFITPNPGINSSAVNEIQRIKKDEPLIGFLTLDEMKIRENLVLRNGKLVGLADPRLNSGQDSCDELATHILAFYVRTVKGEISLPIAWFPTKNTPAWKLAIMVWRVVTECDRLKIQIHAIIADGHATNRKMFKILKGKHRTCDGGTLTAPNVHAPERPIYLLSDTSHLLKTARNALYSSRPGGSKYLCIGGNDVLWTHIQQLFHTDASSLLSESGLTRSHIELTSYSKMKVSLARDVLNFRVGQCLTKIPGAMATADYVLNMAKWFSIMNCGIKSKELPIRSPNDERLDWLETDFVAKFKEWERDVIVNHPGETKRLIAQQTLDGLVFSTINMVHLVRRLLTTTNLKYICLKSFSQDILEAFFGNLRQHGRRCSNPDVNEAAYGIQHVTMRKVIKSVKGGNTTYGEKNAFTQICNEPMPKRLKK